MGDNSSLEIGSMGDNSCLEIGSMHDDLGSREDTYTELETVGGSTRKR